MQKQKYKQQIINIYQHRNFINTKTKDRFLITNCHMEVLQLYDTWLNQQGRGLIVVGETGSGKSHLARIWSQENEANYIECKDLLIKYKRQNGNLQLQLSWEQNYVLVIDDLQILAQCDQEEDLYLLNILNDINSGKGKLLITSEQAPKSWHSGQMINDIKSRLLCLPTVNIKLPEIELMQYIMCKEFLQHGIAIVEPAIRWLVMRLPRSFMILKQTSQNLIRNSLIHKQKINFAAVKQYYTQNIQNFNNV